MREGFSDAVIASMKAKIGESHIERTLQEMELKRRAREQLLEFNFRHDPIVYYMRMDRLVKIGTTRTICRRTAAIMPQGVLAVEFGSVERERERHSQFWDHYSHGEWFWMHDALWQHITELRATAAETLGMDTEDWLKKHGITT